MTSPVGVRIATVTEWIKHLALLRQKPTTSEGVKTKTKRYPSCNNGES